MKHPIRRRIMHLAFNGLRMLVPVLPFGVLNRLGSVVGFVAYWVLGTYRNLTHEHLRQALGASLSDGERRRVAQRVFQNLGKTGLEWLRLHRCSLEDIQRMVQAQGIVHLRQALEKGNGVIIVSAHFGNWELIPLYLRSLGFEGGVLARPLRYSEYESFIISLRGAFGVPTYARGALKDVARILRANQIVGVMPDQDVDSLEGVFVDFFGKATYTPVGPAALSLMTGAPIIPCLVVRERSGFRLVVEKPILPPRGIDRHAAMQQLTQAWTDVLASYISRYPDQWVWMHRRWKTQPSSEAATGRLAGCEKSPAALKARGSRLEGRAGFSTMSESFPEALSFEP